MKPTVLPSSKGTITNSLSLNREIMRAVSLLEIVWQRTGRTQVPAGVADLKAIFNAAIDYLDETFAVEGSETPPEE